MFLVFPGGSDGKKSACIVGDLGSIPGLGRSPGEGNGYPLQYSGLENSMVVGSQSTTERLSLSLLKREQISKISSETGSVEASKIVMNFFFK